MSWLLQIESPWFSLFKPMQELLMEWTGRDIDILLGYRAVRLMFACAVSGLAYLVMSLALFKPQEDDRRILSAMRRFLPWPVNWYLDRKLARRRRNPVRVRISEGI